MSQWEDVPLDGLELLTRARVDPSPRPEPRAQWDDSLEITSEDIKRFNTHVVKSPTCWFWTGAISSPDGYGRFTWQRGRKQRTMLAHRFALAASGINLNGLVAEHFCNEPLCVRVCDEHVFPSTQSDNIRYAVRLGRHRGNSMGVSDGRPQAERSQRIREALRKGWDSDAFYIAITAPSTNQQTLF